MKLCIAATLAAAAVSATILENSVIIEDNVASQILRATRANNGLFEEWGGNDLQRECKDEICSKEELREIIPDNKAKRDETYNELTRKCYSPDHKCSSPGTVKCIQKWNKRECMCLDGYAKGKTGNCDKQIDECKEEGGEKLCKKGTRCVDLSPTQAKPAKYKCVCSNGYAMDPTTKECKDIDECKNKKQCGANAVCKNTPGGFSCDCKAGYARPAPGKPCTDIDECKDNIHKCTKGKKCVNTPGSHKCVDDDLCKKAGESKCGKHGKCVNKPLGKCTTTCDCNKGYAFDQATCSCKDVNECEKTPCPKGDTCHNTDGSHICCKKGEKLVDGKCKPVCKKGEVLDKIANKCKPVPTTPKPVTTTLKPAPKTTKPATTTTTTTTTPAPTTKAPVTIKSPIWCPKGFRPNPSYNAGARRRRFARATTGPFHKDKNGQCKCVDVDECNQKGKKVCTEKGKRNCWNHWGSYRCYDSKPKSESNICHHKYEMDPSSVYGYTCKCFPGHHLCADEATCFANDERKKAHDDIFKSDKSVKCADGQIAYRGKCLAKSAAPASYPDAAAACKKAGGKIACLGDRHKWWYLGNMMQKPFWICKGSDGSYNTGANIHIVNDDKLKDAALLANPMNDMYHSTPQWNAKKGTSPQHYYCEFEGKKA